LLGGRGVLYSPVMPIWIAALVALAGYLLGSIPTGYVAARARGVDIRSAGSGNIGATNVMRVLGKRLGILVLLADALKGGLAAGLLPSLAVALPLASGVAGGPPEWLRILAGASAIVGHNYTCWLGFRGGKGVATTAGVLLVLMPKAFGVCLLVWLVVFALSRIVSLASIAAALALPVSLYAVRSSATLVAVGAALGVLAIYRHRSNIQRLLAGTEPRVGHKPS
jgi:acyl phosphate:glycerol-3-phosphate acyltransferase